MSLPFHLEDGFAFDWGVSDTTTGATVVTVATKLAEVQGCMVSLNEGIADKAKCSIATIEPSGTAGSVDIYTWEEDGTTSTGVGEVTWLAWGKARDHYETPTAGTYS